MYHCVLFFNWIIIIKAISLGLEQRYFLQAMRKFVVSFTFFLKR